MTSQEECKKFTCYNSTISKFYALPKVYKPTLLFRPIISCIDAPTESLFILIADILTRAYDFDNEHYIKDSFQFANKFNDF